MQHLSMYTPHCSVELQGVFPVLQGTESRKHQGYVILAQSNEVLEIIYLPGVSSDARWVQTDRVVAVQNTRPTAGGRDGGGGESKNGRG